MKKKILIIDDEKHISSLLKFILERKGYEVFQANLGKEGIELANQHNPDLILLDVMMPQMDGYEVANILKSENNTKEIAIIMLSSAAQLKDKEKGLDCGVADYLTKPFDKELLLSVIEKNISLTKKF